MIHNNIRMLSAALTVLSRSRSSSSDHPVCFCQSVSHEFACVKRISDAPIPEKSGGRPSHRERLAFHFDRNNVGLKGFHTFFKKHSDEEREHAEKLMEYQNVRGGRILLQDIKKPDLDDWGSGLDAMQAALQLEKRVNQSLLDLHTCADSHGDVQMCDFLEGKFLKDQVKSIKQIGDFVTNLKHVGPGMGEYLFDKESLQSEDA